MVWIARDADERLFIYEKRPFREGYLWHPKYDEFGLETYMIELPSDTDEKLIGRHITWDDEPVEI